MMIVTYIIERDARVFPVSQIEQIQFMARRHVIVEIPT